MNDKLNVYQLIDIVWRNYPRNATTFSNCECGRRARRGGYPCVDCLGDRLVATGKITRAQVNAWIGAILEVRGREREIIEKVGEDAQL